jgi:hypothetical protein
VVGRHSFLVQEQVFLVVEVSVCAKVVCEVGVSDLVGFEHDHVAVLWGGGGRHRDVIGSFGGYFGASADLSAVRF